MFPAGDVVGSESAGFDPPLPPMPGMPVPVFPLSPEGEVMGGMVLAPVEGAGGIVCIPPLGPEVFMAGMAAVEELVPEPLVSMPDIVEELAPAPVTPMFGIVVVVDWPEVAFMPLIEDCEFDWLGRAESEPIAPIADLPWT
jgi:hypothetical protein